MDIAKGEATEQELNALIRRRLDQRVASKGERAEEELWAESERKYAARRREENRIAWCAYYRNVAGALYARAEEYIVRVEKLSREAELGEGS